MPTVPPSKRPQKRRPRGKVKDSPVRDYTYLFGLPVLLGLILTFIPSGYTAVNTVQRAYELYIPIGCSSPHGLSVVATGFPVSPTEVMTAGHALCSPEEELEISLDKGQSWSKVPKENQRVFAEHDVAVLTISGGGLPPPARFRAPRLGELARGFGIPFRGLLLSRYVALVGPDGGFYLDGFPLPGMSGSAVVGEDGYVIGMTTNATSAAYGYMTGGYHGAFLQDLLGGARDDR